MNTLLAVALISFLVGLGSSLPMNESVSNITGINCTFAQNLLSCQYQAENVECDAISSIVNLTVLPIQIFGLNVVNLGDVSNPESVKISLYPRVLDLPVYLLNRIVVNGVTVNLSLYYSLTETDIGLRVTDKVCFERLLNLIKNVEEFHRGSVQQNLVGDSQNVDLFGLLVIDNPDERKVRHFYGGYGGYGRGFGWGRGYGYGRGFGWGRRFGWGRGYGWGRGWF